MSKAGQLLSQLTRRSSVMTSGALVPLYRCVRQKSTCVSSLAHENVMVAHHSFLDPAGTMVDDEHSTSSLIDRLLVETEELMNLPQTSVHVSCYSGGVDSSLATVLLANVGPNVRAILGASPAVSMEQLQQARHIADHMVDLYPNVEYSEVETNEGSSDIYLKNSGEACWACKTHLYSTMQAVVQHVDDITSGHVVVQLYNGTNADDTQDPTRVGLRAAREFRVQSPLRSITKQQVRRVAKAMGLKNWNAAASPCLRSRLALGVEATQGHLEKIERAEREVRLHLGEFNDPTLNLRVRMLSRQRARIEVDQDLVEHAGQVILPQIEPFFLQDLGFSSVSVGAFRSGSVAAVAS